VSVKRFAVAFLPALLLLAACGSGGTKTVVPTPTASGPQPPAPPAKSKADYITQADRICSAAKPETTALQGQFSQIQNSPPSASKDQKEASLWDATVKHLSGTYDQLRALTPPPQDTAVIKSYLDSAKQVIDLVGQLATATRTSNASQAKTLLAQTQAAASRGKGIAQGYGFKVCGSG
jgi:hypothetical protein